MLGGWTVGPFLRIASHKNLQSRSTEAGVGNPTYQEVLTKMIPAEVVALYLGGKTAIEAYFSNSAATPREPSWGYWLGWTLFCLVIVLLYRLWATSDHTHSVPPEWPAVAMAAVSFLIWVYSFGDVFNAFGIWLPLLATLLVLAWTFGAPLIYQRSLK
jgi:hypothetical protein